MKPAFPFGKESFLKKKKRKKKQELPAARILCGTLVMGVLAAGAILLLEKQEQLPGWLSAFREKLPGTEQNSGEADTEALPGTEVSAETEAPAETEPPVPYYDAEGDAAYIPGGHDDPAVITCGTNHRIYRAVPDTDSEAFNAYCAARADELCAPFEAPETSRNGGTTAVTVDYVLYRTESVYSCVFFTRTHGTKETTDVCVLIYDTENNCPYAPLDVYDFESGYMELLARLMREGYEASYAEQALVPDGKMLDEVCQPDPGCFVDIAMDAENLYFYRTAEDAEHGTAVLCSVVPRKALRDCETAVIEERKRQAEEEAHRAEEARLAEEERLAAEARRAEEERLAEEARRAEEAARLNTPEVPEVDYSYALPEREAVEASYFDDALFIGNSLTVGFSRTCRLDAQFLASVGLSVSQFFTKEAFALTDGTTVTAEAAVGKLRFGKVYLMFGINELGWGSMSSFIGYYGRIIDCIREANPDAVIYVQSILPINEEKWAHSGDYNACINNAAVAKFNQYIIDMCEEKEVHFVNVGEVLKDETGNLISEATSDGVHIGGTYMQTWVDYLRTHTAPEKDEPEE